MKKILFPVCFIFPVLLLLLPVRDASAQRLDLSSFLIDTYGDTLLARFSITLDDFDKVKSALDNGSKVALLCNVSLLKDRVFFWDQPMMQRDIEIGLEKNMLSGGYVVIFPSQTRNLDIIDKDIFHELFGNMNVELLTLDKLEPGQKYIVRTQARLISKGVPKWIKRTLFFWSWDLAKSIRYEMRFTF